MFMGLTKGATLHTQRNELRAIVKRILIYLNGLNELLMEQSFVVKNFLVGINVTEVHTHTPT